VNESKPDCYKCKHRGDNVGSAHSRCNHPKSGLSSANPLEEAFAILGSVGRGPGAMRADGLVALNISANPHGVRHNWFQWPFDFDPVWLTNCEGFEEVNTDATQPQQP